MFVKYLTNYLSAWQFNYLLVCLSNGLTFYYICVDITIYQTIGLSIHLSSCLPVYLSSCLCLFIYLFHFLPILLVSLLLPFNIFCCIVRCHIECQNEPFCHALVHHRVPITLHYSMLWQHCNINNLFCYFHICIIGPKLLFMDAICHNYIKNFNYNDKVVNTLVIWPSDPRCLLIVCLIY